LEENLVTLISSTLPTFNDKSPLVRQTDAANQRDSWLRQMELAQLSEMSQVGTLTASGANANKAAPAASWKAILQPYTAENDSLQSYDSQAASAALPVPDQVDQSAKTAKSERDVQAAHAGAPAAVPAAASPDTSENDSTHRTATRAQVAQPAITSPASQVQPAPDGVGARATSQAAPIADIVQAAQSSPTSITAQSNVKSVGRPGAQDIQSARSPGKSALPFPENTDLNAAVHQDVSAAAMQTRDAAPVTGIATGQKEFSVPTQDMRLATQIQTQAASTTMAAVLSSQPRTAQAMSVQQSVDMPMIQAAQSRALTLPTLQNAMADSEKQETMVAPGETAQEEAPAADSPLQEKPTWQKRLMHMTADGEDVKLWIRDTKLGTAQSQNLVYRLAGEIANMGLRLKDATVNGKLAFRSADDTDAVSGSGAKGRARRSDAMRADGQDGSKATDSTISTMEEDHGTQ
jgi:hypothetical protein